LNAAPAHMVSRGDMPPASDVGVARAEMSSYLNSFAMIFGRCVWIPPSPMAALAALRLFYGVGISDGADAAGYEAAIAGQYVSSGKTEAEAQKEIAALNACFGTYEMPPEHRSERSAASVPSSSRPISRE
jgi:hypothetical protein